MELNQLQYFTRIAELGSFSQAARALDVAQPVLSRHIRLLELELGASLFVRHGRGVTLTEKGRLFASQAQGIVHQTEQAIASMQMSSHTIAGRVVLGMPPSLCTLLTAPLHREIQGLYPELKLVIRDGLSQHLLEWLRSGSLDCAIAYNVNAADEFDLTPLGIEKRWLISTPSSKPRAARVTLRQLAKLPLIVPARPHSTRAMLDAAMAEHQLKIKVAAEVDAIAAILRLISAGLGHGVLPLSSIAAFGNAASFVATPIVGTRLASHLCIATALRRPESNAQKAVSRIMTDLVSKGLASDWLNY
jgi:LysR family nitrogen assimilation transcriptional regulator